MTVPDRRLLLDPRNEGPLLAATALHVGALLAWPSIAVVAVGLWWNANTVAHGLVHRRFFACAGLDRGFALVLSVLLGFPQELWRQFHLAHHAGHRRSVRWNRALAEQSVATATLWIGLVAAAPAFFVAVWLPGFVLGQCLCALHGHFEHTGGSAVSHHGRLYNLLFFNDGFHDEHHARPRAGWRELGARAPVTQTRVSRWPPVLRWVEAVPPRVLDGLERLVLVCRPLQHVVLRAHERAVRCGYDGPPPERVLVVGGGLFPRSALLARRLWPKARIVVLDRERRHLRSVQRFCGDDVETSCGVFDGDATGFDLVFVPLALRGSRAALYAAPPDASVVVHDWLWNARGRSRVVAWWLLKRINLLTPERRPRAVGATRGTGT